MKIKFSKTNSFLLLTVFTFSTFVSSCKKKENENTPVGAYEKGVFVINEGPFGSGTGSISVYNRSYQNMSNKIFEQANNFPLGNIVQSMNVLNASGYIVVNNANKIEVVEAGTFKSVGTITGLNAPRYILQVNDQKAYITEWGNGSEGNIRILNLSNNSIEGTINLNRKGAEKMLKYGDYVYVTCQGGYDKDSVVTVIDANTNAIVSNINVGPSPVDIIEDADENLWVLCKGQYDAGYTALEKTGRLVKINPRINAVEQTFVFLSTSAQPSGLTINKEKNKLFYVYDGNVYAHELTASSLSNTAVIKRSFYGLGIDPTQDIMYGADAGNFSSDGKIVRYNLDGTAIDSFTVGIAPNGFYFR